MAKIMDPILPILSVLGYWAIILGSFGGPGRSNMDARVQMNLPWIPCTYVLNKCKYVHICSFSVVYMCVYVHIYI